MSTSSEDADTTISRLLDNRDLLRDMMRMPRRANEIFVEKRRRELFSVFWEEMDMSQQFVLNSVRDQESYFVSEYSNVEEYPDCPEWLLRLEAQDLLCKYYQRKLREKAQEMQ
jgi:hypothetical protein